MFKLVVLSALLAVAAARPGLYEYESHPVVYSEPAIIQEPVYSYAKVGAVIKSIPTAVSHQSSTVVHDSAHYVEPIIAPVVKTYTSPIVDSYSAPVLSSYAHSPVYKSVYSPYSYAVSSPVALSSHW